ncbi:hypothetical protein [Microcoleus sp. Pol12A6]|uniref:hypothetical protein n=1 Tax=Microcoleus sp. Pol12A6 TaxID=3055393 RepID=UPI002FD52AAE
MEALPPCKLFTIHTKLLYQQCEISDALEGLPSALLSETWQLLNEGNRKPAMWFAQQIGKL